MSQVIDLLDDYEESSGNSRDSSPFLREEKGIICLHFNVAQVQSEMYRHAPDELVLGYTRTMMDFLFFNKQPRHIGIVGLGGGSVQKYSYRRLPHTTCSVAATTPQLIPFSDRSFT